MIQLKFKFSVKLFKYQYKKKAVVLYYLQTHGKYNLDEVFMPSIRFH